MKPGVNNGGSYGLRVLAPLAMLVCMPATAPGDESPDGTSGHEHGIGRNRLEACSTALEKADRQAAEIRKLSGRQVSVQHCECEEDPDAPGDERFSCLVYWAVTGSKD